MIANNKLIQQLLEAKREVTALKTAHERGLGLVKVFEREIKMELGGASWFGVLSVTVEVTLKSGEAPYPFASFYPKIDLGDFSSMQSGQVGGLVYSSDGRKLSFAYGVFVPQEQTVTRYAKVQSTSDINTISYHVEPV